HEPVREPDRADPVLCEIGCHPGRFLRPGDPQHARRRQRALEHRESTLELALLGCEELNEVQRADGRDLTLHITRHLPEDTVVSPGRVQNRDRRARLDPQLGDQRLARVPSHLDRPLPSSPVLYRPRYITRQMVPPASSVIYSDPSGPTATPTGRCFGPAGSSFQKPSPNVS